MWRIQLVSGFHLGKIWATNPIYIQLTGLERPNSRHAAA
jgi:hypothetical protein